MSLDIARKFARNFARTKTVIRQILFALLLHNTVCAMYGIRARQLCAIYVMYRAKRHPPVPTGTSVGHANILSILPVIKRTHERKAPETPLTESGVAEVDGADAIVLAANEIESGGVDPVVTVEVGGEDKVLSEFCLFRWYSPSFLHF